MSLVALLVTMALLTETLPSNKRTRGAAAGLAATLPVAAAGLRQIWQSRPMALLVALSFVYVAAGSMLDTTFSLFANLIFGYGPADIGLLFSYMGLVGAVIQLGLIGRIAKALGDAKLVATGIAIYAAGLSIMIVTERLPFILLAMTMVAAANGFFMPGTTSLVTKFARIEDRG